MNFTPLWKEITPHPISSILQATENYHHAIQFIAMCGKNFLKGEEDHSQTNLEWWPDRNCFAGRRIPANPAFRLVLDTENFELVFYRDARHRGEFLSLDGLKKEEVFEWVKGISQRKGLDVSNLTPIQHYQIPNYPMDTGSAYEKPSQSAQTILSVYRSNADLVMAQIAAKFPNSGSVRIWPHHFDTGIYLPIEEGSEAKVSHSLGMGLAIPDKHIQDYYFYVSPWKEGDVLSDKELPGLPEEANWNTQDWMGAALPMGKVAAHTSIPQQVALVETFFQQAIAASYQLLGLSNKP